MKIKIRFNRVFEDVVKKTHKKSKKRQRFEHKSGRKNQRIILDPAPDLSISRKRTKNGKEEIVKEIIEENIPELKY